MTHPCLAHAIFQSSKIKQVVLCDLFYQFCFIALPKTVLYTYENDYT